jgi:CHAT domain-containing protein
MAGAEQHKIRKYLLGQLTEVEDEQVELRLLTELDFAEEYDLVVDEMIDDYVAGNFAGQELEQVEQYFLKAPERQSKLRFAKALKKRKSEIDAGKGKMRRLTPYLAIAASLVLFAGGGFYIWRVLSNNSDLNKGLAALQSAFRDERPLEARISKLDYAPYLTTRGPGAEKIDQDELRRAELTLLDAVKKNPTPAVHHGLGKVYLAKKEFDRAIEQFDEAHKGDPKNAQLYSDLGAAWLEKGKNDREGKEPDKALEEFARSLENLNKALELDPSLLEALFNRALDYKYMMAGREAEASWREYVERDPNSPWAEEAKRNLKQLEDSRQKSSWNTVDALRDFVAAWEQKNDDAAWRVITQSYTSGGNEVTNGLLDALDSATPAGVRDPSAALSYLAKLERERGDDRYTSDLVNQLERNLPKRRQISIEAHRKMRTAYSLFITSQFKDALAIYSEAKQQYEETGDFAAQIFAEYRLAHCYLLLNDLKQADLIFHRVSAICLARQYRWLSAQCFYGLSHANYNRSQYSQAIDYSQRALTTFERTGDLNGVLKSLTQLAQANQTLNRIDRALRYLNRALVLATESPIEPMARWGMLLQIAFDMSSKDLHQAALTYQKEALEVAKKIGRPLITSRSYDYLASAYAAVKEYAEAVETAKRAMETGQAMPKSSGAKEIIAHAWQQLGDIHRQSGNCADAIRDYDMSIDLYGELNVEYYSYGAHKGKLGCFISTNDDQAAAEELSKVLPLFSEYRSKITDESQRVSFFANQQSVYDLAIYFASVRLKQSARAFDYSEASRARTFLDEIRQGAQVLEKNDEPAVNLPNVTHSMSLPEIQANMPSESQVLQYAVLDDRLLIWVVTRSEFHEVSIASEQLNERVQAFLASVNQPPDDAGAEVRAAEDLYRLLIAPVDPYLDKAKYLCIVPDKILHYLPFQALVSPASARFLIEDYDVGIAPSATTFIDLTASAQQKAGAFEEQLLSVGNPRFNKVEFDSLGELGSAAQEAQTVAALYPNPKSRLLLQDDATERTVRSQIEQADLVHFAMHYVVNDQNQTLSGFPLAPDKASDMQSSNGFLQAYEVYSLNLKRARLVVLSGCETGIEQQYAGEGAIGAARPFLIAGVPTIVATLWPVDSEASAELMTSFHRHRREAAPVAKALRSAQIEMARRGDPRHQHPYYWAAFETIGGLSSY